MTITYNRFLIAGAAMSAGSFRRQQQSLRVRLEVCNIFAADDDVEPIE